MLSKNQFFNLELGCTFTSNELHDIHHALYTAIEHYNNIGYETTANNLKQIFIKVGKIIDNANSI